MKRVVAFLMCGLVINNISFAYVKRDIIITSEKTIPFSFYSQSPEISEDISIKGLNDVVIKDIYIDNGEVESKIFNNYIELNFSNGEKSSGNRSVTKTKTIDISELKIDGNILIIEPDEEINEILEFTGDISNVTINNEGNIEIIIKEDAVGINGYDHSRIETSQFNITIDEANREREIVSDEVIIEHDIIEEVIPISGDTSSVQEIVVDNNRVKVIFNNGIPKINENSLNSGYTYCWVDRDEEGKFKTYKPNSIYSTDINKITGLGEFLDKDDFDEIGMTVSNENWKDYCGVEIDGKRYVYVYDKDRGIPNELKGDLIEKDYIIVEGQNLNTERYKVEFENTKVSYVLEGKLYSMGELVKGTNGWGEVYPNNTSESKKTFFNELTGKYETYVKHFKFFYGPKQKKTFGGYYTYPYNAKFEYKHYAPIKYYLGEIVYSYLDKEKVNGYLYNGYVKIEFNEIKNVNDYPPTAPDNVKYNALTGIIRWGAGSDDYTLSEELIYEIQVFQDDWITYKITNKGVLQESCPKGYESGKIRIRTVDSIGQYSSWSYALESDIEIDGSLIPYIVSPGGRINILANIKSFEKIEKVTAQNDEMQMYAELQKVSEGSSTFYEMSYNLEADFPEDESDYIVVSKGVNAIGNKEEFETYEFKIKDKFEDSLVRVKADEDIKLNTQNGTIIYSNQNYLDTPKNMFSYNGKTWFLDWDNEIKFLNKVTNKENSLFLVESDAKRITVDKKNICVPTAMIRVNKFEYDEKGLPTYYEVEIDKSLAGKPFAIRWNTDVSGITEFKISFENEVAYSYKVKYEDINRYVDNFFSIESRKKMKKYIKSAYGYVTPSKSENADWAEIVFEIAKKRNIQDFLWLGYKVRNNEYINLKYVQEYNSNPNVRNNYRLFIADEEISDIALNKYISMLKNSNVYITRDKNTVWGDDVIQYTSMFNGCDVLVPENTSPGKYEILLTAYDVEGKVDTTYLTLFVEEEEEYIENRPEDNENYEEVEDVPIIKEYRLGRFFYRDGQRYLEELSKTNKTTNVEGFLCAGETLGVVIKANNTDYIEIDFWGDSSIKVFDKLTQKFLVDNPAKNGKIVENIEEYYKNFPKKIYPQYVDKSGESVFTYFYVVPYGTLQSLESWNTLKRSTLKNIDKSKLFDRITNPYEMIIYLNGDRENYIKFKFDVFERWDTVLNRNVTNYISNFNTKWEMRVDK